MHRRRCSIGSNHALDFNRRSIVAHLPPIVSETIIPDCDYQTRKRIKRNPTNRDATKTDLQLFSLFRYPNNYILRATAWLIARGR